NAKAFALARKARAVPGARVRATFDADLRAPIKGLNDVRLLAERLNDGAQFMELRGDHVEAVGRLRDMLHIARAVRQDPSLACQAVAAGIDESACYRARVIGPGLRLRPADPRAAQVRAAVNELISDLLDERALADGLARALYADRIALTEQVRRSGAERWAIRPLAESQIAHEWAAFPSWIDAARARDWPAAKASIDRLLVASRNHVAEDRPLLGWLAGTGVTDRLSRYSRWFWEGVPYDRAIEKGFRTIAERRVTAVLLAMQLFRADRDRWPARLDELVPAYLKGVPGDPFRAGAPPVGYVVLPKALRNGGDRPLVYFDHGSADPVDPRAWREPMYDWHQSSSTPRRQYRDAARFRPGDLVGRKSGALAPRPDPDPSSEGVDNDPGKSDQPRQDQQEKRGPDRPQDE
ncbi:MAG TPA: hypothetical protein VK986_01630, partial [Tepidisphaeraceae bacterium]|nr:hypothetical protein [Tepidisphaeraceae bacterium]